MPNEFVYSDGWSVKHMLWNPLGVGTISQVNIGFCAVCANFLAFEVSFLNFAILDVFGTAFASAIVVVGENGMCFVLPLQRSQNIYYLEYFYAQYNVLIKKKKLKCTFKNFKINEVYY